ncbi:hypothetical protein ACCO45_001407 [Purpureocillium lilacinum]|uniref:Uncharacterized protein n=1 Tax=Purpureocillium lilacinum TaxID=33203 RepID=A0ACC4EA55_PURLI
MPSSMFFGGPHRGSPYEYLMMYWYSHKANEGRSSTAPSVMKGKTGGSAALHGTITYTLAPLLRTSYQPETFLGYFTAVARPPHLPCPALLARRTCPASAPQPVPALHLRVVLAGYLFFCSPFLVCAWLRQG